MSQAAHAVSETGGELNGTWSHAQRWNRDNSPAAAAAGFVALSSSSAGEKRPHAGSSTSRDRQEAGKSGGAEPEHEIHIWTERERRKKMRNMFSSLHALLPHLPAKADKSTIVDEAVKHIKALQQKLEKLQKQKLEHLHGERRPPPPPHPPAASGSDQTASTAVSREAFLAEQGKSYFPINSPSPATGAAAQFTSQSLQTWSSPNVVLSVSGDDAFICISAPKKPGLLSTVVAVMEKHKLDLLSASVSADFFRTMIMIHARASDAGGQLPETLMNEEIYKLAVGEMIIWLSTSPTH
ncbi:transcription factor bHLH95 [Curcuma longa]|uniref:transcription factor bHLH95 n=1 Tax=Curcuma longa TaxID=136217 RepID=UPI003D9F9B82